MREKILAINPGSTSTKIAVYQAETCLFEDTIRHQGEELKDYKTIVDQFDFRLSLILERLDKHHINISELTAVVGRGGMLKPLSGGTYEVSNEIINDLRIGVQGQHASNLGGLLAHEISTKANIKAYIVDPVVVDELEPEARVTGVLGIERKSIFHALNQKAVAKKHAQSLNKPYNDLNLIVAHLGGGISVGAHYKGRIVEVNNAVDGDGPFSPERAGTIPSGALVDLCFSEQYNKNEIKKMINGKGGIMSHLGLNDDREVIKLADEGNTTAALIQKAMTYQVAKSIGACSAVLCGQVDAILITGGIAYDKQLIKDIKSYVGFIAPVIAYPGEDEMEALVLGVLRVIRGEEETKVY